MADGEKGRHDLKCALRPGECRHTVAEMKTCVICGGDASRSVHVDTCGEACFKRLMIMQREERARPDA